MVATRAGECLLLGPGPGIKCAVGGAETAGQGHGGSGKEAAGESVRFVGVASERDCYSALVAPPPDDLRAERRFGVDFQRPAAARKHAQGVTEFLLERCGVESPGCSWPVAHRVIDVSEHGESL